MFRFSKLALAAVTFFALSLAAATESNADPLVLTPISSPAGTTIDFESAVTVAGGGQYGASATVAGHPVTFAYSGPAGTNNGVGVATGDGLGTTGNGLAAGNHALFVNAPAGTLTPTLQITFDPSANVNSFSFDIKASDKPTATGPTTLTDGSYTITITDVNNNTFTTTVAATDYTNFNFVGFSSATNLASITIAMNTGGQPFLDNFSYNAAAPTATPEPATLLLYGSGLAGLASVARKRRAGRKDEGDDCGDE